MHKTNADHKLRFELHHVESDVAQKLVDKMRSEGWTLEGWEPIVMYHEGESACEVFLAFTRPQEGTVVDVKPVLDELTRWHSEVFKEDRSDVPPCIGTTERLHFDEGRLRAYRHALNMLQDLTVA